MASLDDLLGEAQKKLMKAGHGLDANAVGAARKELQRLLQPMDDGLHHLEVGTLLSHRTKQGVVELMLNREKTQMDLDKAREVLGMLSQAIEAAVSDTLIYAFLTGPKIRPRGQSGRRRARRFSANCAKDHARRSTRRSKKTPTSIPAPFPDVKNRSKH